MRIPGFDGFRKHLPDYSDKDAFKIFLRLPRFAVLFLFLAVALFHSLKLLNLLFESEIWVVLESIVPLITYIFLVFFGTVTAQKGFNYKAKLQAINKEKAYQMVVKSVLAGIAMVFAGILYGYFPIIFPMSEMTRNLAQPFDDDSFGIVFKVVRILFGLVLLILAGRTAFRAIQDFGIDTASLVYVYYPEEAKVVDDEIYSIVRHPMYLSIVLFGVGSFCIYFSIYSLILLIIIIGSFYRHILCEEKELLERFGPSYKDYSKKTPAILIKTKDWGKYFMFLNGSKKKDKQ
jgi:protein-S-isoprenylcysteine O-methyltransferase Ste14